MFTSVHIKYEMYGFSLLYMVALSVVDAMGNVFCRIRLGVCICDDNVAPFSGDVYGCRRRASVSLMGWFLCVQKKTVLCCCCCVSILLSVLGVYFIRTTGKFKTKFGFTLHKWCVVYTHSLL